jgi:hypothetical protein
LTYGRTLHIDVPALAVITIEDTGSVWCFSDRLQTLEPWTDRVTHLLESVPNDSHSINDINPYVFLFEICAGIKQVWLTTSTMLHIKLIASD